MTAIVYYMLVFFVTAGLAIVFSWLATVRTAIGIRPTYTLPAVLLWSMVFGFLYVLMHYPLPGVTD